VETAHRAVTARLFRILNGEVFGPNAKIHRIFRASDVINEKTHHIQNISDAARCIPWPEIGQRWSQMVRTLYIDRKIEQLPGERINTEVMKNL
jgi:hypothetical protein